MPYHILPYSYNQAKTLGVTIKPSNYKGNKIDVYKNNKYICSIGSLLMMDYPTYIKEKGKEYAENRRKLYKLRHKKDNIIGTRGYYAFNILW